MPRKAQFAIFFSIAITLYGLLNLYIFSHAWDTLEIYPHARLWFGILFWFWVSIYIITRILENFVQNIFTNKLNFIGAWWLGLMAYLFLLCFVVDVGFVVSIVFDLNPYSSWGEYLTVKFQVGIIVFSISSILTALGFWNARTPIIKKIELEIPKRKSPARTWNFAVASDIHIGAIVDRKRFNVLVNQINSLNVDAVFLLGDTIDEDIKPVIREDIGNALKQIHSVHGTFAINGNHEHIGGADEADRYLTEHGVIMLRDKSTFINESFTLVGREDRSANRFNGYNRLSIEELLHNVSADYPIIMLDHQPSKLNDVAKDGRVDIQLSGHTHHGQLWPFHIFTKLLFEVSWGLKKIHNTYFYVSSGWGTWGPPMRIGNTPELIHLVLRFT